MRVADSQPPRFYPRVFTTDDTEDTQGLVRLFINVPTHNFSHTLTQVRKPRPV